MSTEITQQSMNQLSPNAQRLQQKLQVIDDAQPALALRGSPSTGTVNIPKPIINNVIAPVTRSAFQPILGQPGYYVQGAFIFTVPKGADPDSLQHRTYVDIATGVNVSEIAHAAARVQDYPKDPNHVLFGTFTMADYRQLILLENKLNSTDVDASTARQGYKNILNKLEANLLQALNTIASSDVLTKTTDTARQRLEKSYNLAPKVPENDPAPERNSGKQTCTITEYEPTVSYDANGALISRLSVKAEARNRKGLIEEGAHVTVVINQKILKTIEKGLFRRIPSKTQVMDLKGENPTMGGGFVHPKGVRQRTELEIQDAETVDQQIPTKVMTRAHASCNFPDGEFLQDFKQKDFTSSELNVPEL